MTIDKQKLQKLLWAEAASYRADCADWKRNTEALQEFLGEKTVEEVALELLAENGRLQSAARTLERLRYTDNGGELWKPPLGEKPDFSLIDQLRAENEALRDGANFRAIQSLRKDCEALRKDAEIGRLIFQFFDRMDDPTDCDPLEKSTGEFLRAVAAAMSKDVQP